MVPALIATPSPNKTENDSAREIKPSIEVERHGDGVDAAYDEDRHIIGLLMLLLAITVVPAIILAVYIIFNPDSFQYDITPQKDFSTWHPGKSL